jgi:outer membrane protein OmpA-like peptidoglycan-associated protein
MRSLHNLAGSAALAALLATTACTTDPDTGRQHLSNTAIGGIGGALGGYLLGDLVGGRHDRTAKIAGAGIGGLAGAAIGSYMDKQERDLRERTAGTEVRVIRQGDDLILSIPSGINFAYNSDAVAPAFQHTLDDVARVLGQYDRTYIDVYGHTDAVGSDQYNQALSERRAKAVADYLVSRGVQAPRLATRGYGKTEPVAANDTESGRAANRRVEIKIVPIAESDLR